MVSVKRLGYKAEECLKAVYLRYEKRKTNAIDDREGFRRVSTGDVKRRYRDIPATTATIVECYAVADYILSVRGI